MAEKQPQTKELPKASEARSKELDPSHPFAKEWETGGQINAAARNDRLRILKEQEAQEPNLEKKREIRAQINAIRREANRAAQRDAYVNPSLSQDETFSKKAKELLGEGDLDTISAKHLLGLELAKRGSLSKLFAFKRTHDANGLEMEEPLDMSKVQAGDEIVIDFGKNSGADVKVGAGDLLPMSIKAVAITDTQGRVRVGIRSNPKGAKVGYYDGPAPAGYIEIHNGYTIRALGEKEADEALKALQSNVPLSTDDAAETKSMEEFMEEADRFPSLGQQLSALNIEQYHSYQQKATALAKEIEATTGIPWQVTYGMATLETGYGQHAPNNNYFGIKGRGSAQKTTEFINGSYVTINASFRSYASMEASFQDFANLITGRLYRKAFEHTGDPRAFLQAVLECGYANEPAYLSRVERIWNDYDHIKEATPESLSKPTPPNLEAKASPSAKGLNPNIKITPDQLLSYAAGYAGTPYLYWGNGKHGTLDCSHFVAEALKKCGMAGSGFYVTAAGFHSMCTPKNPSDVRAGDLVFLTGKKGEITHVEVATAEAVNNLIPIVDASGKSNAGEVHYRTQRIDGHVLVGTPPFYA